MNNRILRSVFLTALTVVLFLGLTAISQPASAEYPCGGARQPAWTDTSTLPGGDFEPTEFAGLHQRYSERFPFLAKVHLERLLHCYGTRTEKLLGDAASLGDLGQHFGSDLYQMEVDYLIEREWALDADDILFRRTKLGIRMDDSQKLSLQTYLSKQKNLRS